MDADYLKSLLCLLPSGQRKTAGERIVAAEREYGFTDIRFFDRMPIPPESLHMDDLIGLDAQGDTEFLPVK